MRRRFRNLFPAALCAAFLLNAGSADAFSIPHLPVAPPVGVCGSFEAGSLDHACCLQFPSDDIARRCCSVGFSPSDGDGFACCQENAGNGIHPGTPDAPTTCEPDDPPDDPEDPITACAILYPGDDVARRCCEVGFDPVDEAKFLCCQQNAHHNVHPGTPSDPTACEPSGSEEETPDPSEALPEDDMEPADRDVTPGKCLITAVDAQTDILLKVEYLLPNGLSGVHEVQLSQTSGPSVIWRDTAALSPADDASSRFQWTVQMGRPEKMIGEFPSNASFRVVVSDAQGKSLHQATCEEKAGLHAQGGSSGCSLIP